MEIATQPTAQDFQQLMLRLHEQLLKGAKGDCETNRALEVAYAFVSEAFPDRVRAYNAQVMGPDAARQSWLFLDWCKMVQVGDEAFTLDPQFPKVLPLEQFVAEYSQQLLAATPYHQVKHRACVESHEMNEVNMDRLPPGWGDILNAELEAFPSHCQARALDQETCTAPPSRSSRLRF